MSNPNELFTRLAGTSWPARTDRIYTSGQIPGGVNPQALENGRLQELTTFFGAEFLGRVLLTALPSTSLEAAEVSVTGGWCVLRTKDVENLEKGFFIDPVCGESLPIRTVADVVRFISTTITFDQIVDAIGYPNNPQLEYAAISETTLWANRIIEKTSRLFQRQLTTAEADQIRTAVEQAETIRYQMTERYLQLATANPHLRLTRIPDTVIFSELQRVRDELLKQARLGNVADLAEKYQQDRDTVDGSTMVISLYTQPVFDLYRALGYLSSERPLGMIVEPASHAYGNTQLVGDFIRGIHRQAGKYYENGLNAHLGQAAYLESSTGDGNPTRRDLTPNQVPNIHNWPQLLADGFLALDQNNTLNPNQNQLFIWGVNLLPFGANLEPLQRLVQAQAVFKTEKAALSAPDKNERERLVKQLKDDILKEYVQPANELIHQHLAAFFGHLTHQLS